MVDGYARRGNTDRDIQPVAIQTLDLEARKATGLTRVQTEIQIDIAYATGETIVTPAVGEQWYVERFDQIWRLYGRIPFNDETLLTEPVEGQVSVGGLKGPLELFGTEANFHVPYLSINDTKIRVFDNQFQREDTDGDWVAVVPPFPFIPADTDDLPEGDDNLYFTDARASAAAPVQSVLGAVGDVVFDKSDLGLGNVENLAPADLPVSSATTSALGGKADLIGGLIPDAQLPAIETSKVTGLDGILENITGAEGLQGIFDIFKGADGGVLEDVENKLSDMVNETIESNAVLQSIFDTFNDGPGGDITAVAGRILGLSTDGGLDGSMLFNLDNLGAGLGIDLPEQLDFLTNGLSDAVNETADVISALFGGSSIGSNLLLSQIPGLPTSKITSGIFPQTIVSGLPSMAANLATIFSSADFTSGGFDPLSAILSFLNVSGALGPSDIGGTAQGIVDQFISGFVNSIGTGSGLADAFNVANIIGSQSFLGKVAYDITQLFNNKPFNSGMNPTAVSTIGFDTIAAAVSLPTTAVTQSNTIMGLKLFEQASSVNYITWLGSGVASITGLFVDIWKFVPATSAFEWICSVNGLSVAGPTTQYNTVQLPFQVDVEAGEILAAEIVPVGAGTHTVAAVTGAVPNRNDMVPKNMAARKSMSGSLYQPRNPLGDRREPFDSIDTSIWTPYGDILPSIAGGRLSVPSTSSGLVRTAFDDMGGKQAWVEVPQVAPGPVPTQFEIYEDGSSPRDFMRIYQIGGNLFFDVEVAGVVNQSSVTYNATTHRWWRINFEDNANIIFETSTDGWTWTPQRTVAKPAAYDMTKMVVNFFVGGYADDFNRANSTTTVGTGWTNRRNTMGINTNAAYPVTTDDSLSIATSDGLAPTDDMAARITLGSLNGAGRDSSSVIIGANTSGELVGAYWDGTNTGIFTKPAWATAETVRFSSGAVTFTTGNDLEIRRAGNVYTVYKNNVATAVTWTDSTNIIPRDSSHRLTGIGGRNNAGNYRRIDTFATTAPGITPALFDNYNMVPAANLTYVSTFPYIEFAKEGSQSTGIPYHSPDVTSYDSSTTYIVEDWVNTIEPVALGAGGGGHDGAFGFSGEGGLGGNFSAYTVWTRGVHFTTGSAVTISRGAGGTTVGSDGQNGGNTTITVNGNTVTGTGGAGGDQSATSAAMVPGKSPGSVTYNGQPYVGGVQQNSSGANGVGPGGGGAGGTQPSGNGGTGANGRAWLKKIQ